MPGLICIIFSAISRPSMCGMTMSVRRRWISPGCLAATLRACGPFAPEVDIGGGACAVSTSQAGEGSVDCLLQVCKTGGFTGRVGCGADYDFTRRGRVTEAVYEGVGLVAPRRAREDEVVASDGGGAG